MLPQTEARIRGGWALMAKVRCGPGWSAVQAQADQCGMFVHSADDLHVTVLFLGRDMVASRADKVRAALTETMQELTNDWRAGVESGRFRVPGRLVGGPIPAAFLPMRFPGVVGQFPNKTATHVHVECEPGAVLVAFRNRFRSRLGFDVRDDFGGYRPHVTLAEGPAGSSLRRPALVPPSITNSSELVLKIGSDIREKYVFS